MSNSSPDITIVGAGITGAAAAYRLSQLGVRAEVYETSLIPGGRMARFELSGVVFDHGAQFFTTRSSEFQSLVGDAANDGAAQVWTHGFGDTPDGYERWRGVPDMTALADWLLRKSEATVHLGESVEDLRHIDTPGIILTAPIPVSLSLATTSGFKPPSNILDQLETVEYKRTVAVLLVLNQQPLAMPPMGGIQLIDDPCLAFITDNQAKGVSSIPALTIHLSNEASLDLWDQPDEIIVEFALKKVGAHIGDVDAGDHSVTRWRYAGPVDVIPEFSVVWNEQPTLVMAGEAFNGPKVEGAFNSGIDAANKVVACVS